MQKKKQVVQNLDRPLVEPTCGKKVSSDISSEDFYMTSAINYTNGPPHMGHAYEAITIDAVARYQRLFGRNVFWLTGSDEHGQKVEKSALDAGVKPIDIADKYSNGFQSLNKLLKISNDNFVRTSSEKHKLNAQELWNRVKAKGDIYLDNYEGWYNMYDECYVTDKEAEELGYKDEYGRPFEKKSEESYFFRQSKYQDAIIKYIKEENPAFVQPESRRKEVLGFLSEPLRDVCISRTVCQWGVKCPNDPQYKGDKSHVMYVWFDALSNYLTGIGYFEKGSKNAHFWDSVHHVIGKDITRFHCILWPCMLMSAGLPPPKTVFAHGFVVASDGRKMSKSLNNFMDPLTLLRRYNSDSLRFYLSRSSKYGSDFPLSEDALCGLHNAVLKDGLGNMLHRSTSLCKSYSEGKIPCEKPFLLDKKFPIDINRLKLIYELSFSSRPCKIDIPEKYKNDSVVQSILSDGELADGFQMQIAGDAIAEAINNVNRYLQTVEPWNIKEKDEETMKKKRAMVRCALESIYIIAHFLVPFVPDSMEKIFDKIGVEKTYIPLLKDNFENLPPGTITYVGDILYHEFAPGKGIVERNTGKKSGGGKEAYEKAQKAKKAAKAALQAASNAPEFTKLDLRVGKIVKAWHHENSDKLFCEEVDVGEEKPRKIGSGLREHYKLEEFENQLVVVVCNLKPRKLAGFESHGMILCATTAEKVELLKPPTGSKPGERLGLIGNDPNEFKPEEPNKIARKKIFETVSKKLLTNDAKEGCWDGKQIVSSAGPVMALTLKNTQIG